MSLKLFQRQIVSFGVDKVITLKAIPLNQSATERDSVREKYYYIERVNALTNRPKCIVHTYIMSGEYKGIGRCLWKWLNFDLLKLKDYSDWKRFMGFNHYIYKSSFSPAAIAVGMYVCEWVCMLYIVLMLYRARFFSSFVVVPC